MTTTRTRPAGPGVGELLREWRERRRLSQLALSLQADVSTRHLSFVETGRSRPTSEMILRLTEQLDVPLRDRNTLLLAGGFAPAYPEHELQAPDLEVVRGALRQVLSAHEPYPALVIDRHWNLLDANAAVALLTEGCAADLLEPPLNVLRLSLHPEGMASRIENLGQWRAHLLHRLQRQAAATGDAVLDQLHAELLKYPADPAAGDEALAGSAGEVVVPLRYRIGTQALSLLSTTAVFGTPLDVTVAELAIESFFPADAATATTLRRLRHNARHGLSEEVAG